MEATVPSPPGAAGAGVGGAGAVGAGVVGPAASPDLGPAFKSQEGSSGPAATAFSGFTGCFPVSGEATGAAEGFMPAVVDEAGGGEASGSVFLGSAGVLASVTGIGVAVGTSVALCPGRGIAMGGDEGLAGAASGDGSGCVAANSEGAPIAGVPGLAGGVALVSVFADDGVGGTVGLGVLSVGVPSDKAPRGALRSQNPMKTSITRNSTTPKMYIFRF